MATIKDKWFVTCQIVPTWNGKKWVKVYVIVELPPKHFKKPAITYKRKTIKGKDSLINKLNLKHGIIQ